MPTLRNSLPSYCLYKRSGQAVVRLSGRDYYLGRFRSPESRERYDRFVAEWLMNGRQPPEHGTEVAGGLGPTIDELIVCYMEFAKSHYRKGETVTTDVGNIKDALRPLQKLYGSTPAQYPEKASAWR